MEVKLLTHHRMDGSVLAPGAIVTVEDAQAEAWIAEGAATALLVDAPEGGAEAVSLDALRAGYEQTISELKSENAALRRQLKPHVTTENETAQTMDRKARGRAGAVA